MNVRNKIWILWQSENYRQRTGDEAETLAREAWAQGLRLSSNENTHYQLVMEMVRFSLRK